MQGKGYVWEEGGGGGIYICFITFFYSGILITEMSKYLGKRKNEVVYQS